MRRALVAQLACAGLAWAGPACATDDDPLGRAAVAELARSRGDAQGGERTGTWNLRFAELTCNCPVEIADRIVLCDVDNALGFIPVSMRVVEGDGVITLAPEANSLVNPAIGGELSGPIDADGTFEAGEVRLGLGFAAELLRIARLEAEMDGADSFAGDLRVRLRGKVGDARADCDASYGVDGFRLF